MKSSLKTNFLKIFAKKFADSKNVRTFAIPLETKGVGHQPKRLVFLAPKLKEFIEKTVKLESTSKVPRTTRALILLKEIREHQGQASSIRIYKEEFDPGSG